MTRFILIYGSIAGLVVATLMVGGIAISNANGSAGSQVFGYLSMLVAMSIIFVAVKRYRDTQLGGVIKFWPALGLGAGIALLASLFYVFAWEIYFNSTGGAWVEVYVEQIRTQYAEQGRSGEEIEAYLAETQSMMELYRNWWFRMPITLTEILPVGLLVGLISAAILRNPKVLPRRA